MGATAQHVHRRTVNPLLIEMIVMDGHNNMAPRSPIPRYGTMVDRIATQYVTWRFPIFTKDTCSDCGKKIWFRKSWQYTRGSMTRIYCMNCTVGFNQEAEFKGNTEWNLQWQPRLDIPTPSRDTRDWMDGNLIIGGASGTLITGITGPTGDTPTREYVNEQANIRAAGINVTNTWNHDPVSKMTILPKSYTTTRKEFREEDSDDGEINLFKEN